MRALILLALLAPPAWGQVAAPEAPTPPDGVQSPEASELEELRALEEASIDPAATAAARLSSVALRLGYGNPLRSHLEWTFDELESRALFETEAPVVTDVAAFDAAAVRGQYDIPVEMQPLVSQYVQFFQGPGRKWFRRWMSRSTRFVPLMQAILEQHGLPRDTIYLAMIESGFSAKAYSWAHAAGPWQFISTTGRAYGLRQDFWVDERRDPIKSTHAASRFLARLYADLGHWYLAWAGYNAGGARLARMVERKGTQDFWVISEGRGLAKETKHYVPKLIAAALVAKNLKTFGFSEEEFDYLPRFEFDEVEVVGANDLEVLAAAAGVEVETIQELNPELMRWCTPPSTRARPYVLRVPFGTKERFLASFKEVPPSEQLQFRVHRVRRGDTLSRIAARYNSAPEAIMRLNGLESARTLKVNVDLAIPVRGGALDTAFDRQVVQARRAGFRPSRPEDEVPAGARTKPAAQGTIRTQSLAGRTQITYTVASGDSLWLIAQRFKCTVDDLRRWNRLPASRRSPLQIGTPLIIWQ